MKAFLLILITSSWWWGYGQPNTEVYLFDLEALDQAPINISNNPGYDNQPSFWDDSQSILYARTEGDQTEIARYFIESKETILITNTVSGSEFSPTQIPGTDNISSIRLDKDGLQLLYKYDLTGNSTVLVPELKIGYHAWVSNTNLAAFVLGNPNTLQYINLTTGQASILQDSIGRCITPFPQMNGFSYVDASKIPEKITLSIPDKEATYDLISLPEGTQDFCWSADGGVTFSSSGTKLLQAGRGEIWSTVVDLKNFGLLGKISRMAASPNGKWLCLVLSEE